MFLATTGEIEVSVEPVYLDEQSIPQEFQYVWAYRVRIANHRKDTVKLMTRRWIITDGNGMVQEVEGPGVIGETPTLHPGETFEYSSYTMLSTPTGIMTGKYRMIDEVGTSFDVAIPAFSLDSPEQILLPN